MRGPCFSVLINGGGLRIGLGRVWASGREIPRFAPYLFILAMAKSSVREIKHHSLEGHGLQTKRCR